MQTKKCSRCGDIKNIDEFSKHKLHIDGLQSYCKKCIYIYKKKYVIDNSEKVKQSRKAYRLNNHDKINKYNKQWNKNNPEKVKQHKKNHYLKDPERFKQKDRQYDKKYCSKNYKKISQRAKKWRLDHPEDPEHRSKYNKNRYKNDIEFRIITCCRGRIWRALKGYCKSAHSIELLMCSITEVKLYLESLWLPGMTWDNWGNTNGKWNIDHIIPCSFFNMLDPVEQYMCFRWQNMQPLWQTDNLEKSDKINIIL